MRQSTPAKVRDTRLESKLSGQLDEGRHPNKQKQQWMRTQTKQRMRTQNKTMDGNAKNNKWERKSPMSGWHSMANWTQGPWAQVPEHREINFSGWTERTMNETAKRRMSETEKETMKETAKRTMNENATKKTNKNANPRWVAGIRWPTGPRGPWPWAQSPENKLDLLAGRSHRLDLLY